MCNQHVQQAKTKLISNTVMFYRICNKFKQQMKLVPLIKFELDCS